MSIFICTRVRYTYANTWVGGISVLTYMPDYNDKRIDQLPAKLVPDDNDLIVIEDALTNTFYKATFNSVSGEAPVKSVAGKTGDVTLTKSDVGLANVDNTSDASKPVSTATQTALDAKATTTYVNTQNALDEKLANKATSLASPDNTKYPTTLAVADAISVATIPDATTTVKGKLKLANDLGGTADLPTTPTAVHLAGTETITGTKTFPATTKIQGSTNAWGFSASGSAIRNTGTNDAFYYSDNNMLWQPNGGATKMSLLAGKLILDGGDPTTALGAATKQYVDAVKVNINPKDAPYNAKGDGKYVDTGSMTAGSAILTATGAGFASTDVGKAIMVTGAGNDGSGLMMNTTIASFQSSTQVTVAVNATNTITGTRVVWGTDDTTALNSALTAASGKAPILLPNGVYLTPNKVLNVGVNSGIIGQNIDSTIIVGSGINAQSDSTLVSDLTIDSNNNFFWTALYSKGITKFFNRLKLRNWGRYGIDFANDATRGQGSKNGYIMNCDFNHNGKNGTSGGCVEVEGNYVNIHIIGNDFGASPANGCVMEVTVAVGDSDPGLNTAFNNGLYFERNRVMGPFAKSGYAVGRHVRVRDNDFFTSFQFSSGGKEGATADSTWISQDMEFSGNTMHTNSNNGQTSNFLLVTGQSPGDSGIIRDVKITNNRFEDASILYKSAENSVLEDILIANNKFVDANQANIWFYSLNYNTTYKNVNVLNNSFSNWLSTGPGEYASTMFTVEGSGKTIIFDSCKVRGNTYFTPRVAATKALYVQQVASGSVSGTLYADNNDFGTTSVVDDSTTTIKRKFNNVGNDPLTAGTVGSATQVPVLGYDARGLLTAVSSAPVTATASGAAAGDLAGTYPNPTIKPSVGLTGVPTAPTATSGTNTTQIASTAYVVGEIASRLAAADALIYKGIIDASINPNYPAADAGFTYKISVAGKIGGASGMNVMVNDMIICTVDGSASGTQAAVGANWDIIQANLDIATTTIAGIALLGAAGGSATFESTATRKSIMTQQATQTASFTAAANNFYPINASAGNVTVTLPTSTAGQEIQLKKLDANAATGAGSGIVFMSGTINGTPSANIPLRKINQGKQLLADGTGGWSLVLGDLDITSLQATTIEPGTVQLAGDLSGTATAPTVPGLTSKLTLSILPITSSLTGASINNVFYRYYWSGSTAYTFTLPTAVGNTSEYRLMNKSTINQVVNFTGGQNADGSTTITLLPNQVIDFTSNNTNWMIG